MALIGPDPTGSDAGAGLLGRDARSGRPRPAYLRPAALALVTAGGAVGTAARAALALAFPTPSAGFPWTTAAINLVGTFLLGLLLGGVGRLGDGSQWARRARLTVGTGLLGGFTTYSTFSVETVRLASGGHAGWALVYAVGSVVMGVCLATAALTWTRPRRGSA